MLFLSKSEKETQKMAGNLATKVIKLQKPVIMALEGELGAGKTTFAKGFAKALGVRTRIKSPTFVLMKKYSISSSGYSSRSQDRRSAIASGLAADRYLYHLDCYRVGDHNNLSTLDLGSIFSMPGNIVLIEWPERVREILPKKLIRVRIDHISLNKRKIQITGVS